MDFYKQVSHSTNLIESKIGKLFQLERIIETQAKAEMELSSQPITDLLREFQYRP